MWTTARTVDGALHQLGVRADGARLSASRSAAIARRGLDLEVRTERVGHLRGRRPGPRGSAPTRPPCGEAVPRPGSPCAARTPRPSRWTTSRATGRPSRSCASPAPAEPDRSRSPSGPCSRADPTLTRGTETVRTEGRPGIRRVTYRVRTVNGVTAAAAHRCGPRSCGRPVAPIVPVGTTPRRTAGRRAPTGSTGRALAHCESGGRPGRRRPLRAATAGSTSSTCQHLARSRRARQPAGRRRPEQTYRAKKLYVSSGARVPGRTAAISFTGERVAAARNLRELAPHHDALLGPADVRELAAALGVRPTKQRGQNFVIDANTVRRIVRTAEVRPDDVVVEVGPGLGSLTLALLEAADRVTAVEIDDVLAARAARDRRRPAAGPCRPLRARALRRAATSPSCRGPRPTALVANLPYNVAVPVLLHMLATLPDHRAHPGHGAVRGRRPARRPARLQGLRRALGEGRLVRRRQAGRRHRPQRLLARAQRRLRAGLPGAADRAGPTTAARARGLRASSTRPSPSAARRCAPPWPAGPGRPPPPRPRWSRPASRRRRAGESLTVEEFAAIAEHGPAAVVARP